MKLKLAGMRGESWIKTEPEAWFSPWDGYYADCLGEEGWFREVDSRESVTKGLLESTLGLVPSLFWSQSLEVFTNERLPSSRALSLIRSTLGELCSTLYSV